MSGKGNSRQERSARGTTGTTTRQASESANPTPLARPSDAGDGGNGGSISMVIELIESFRAETRSSLDTLQSTVDSFASRLVAVETSLQECDDRLTALEAKCETLEKSNKRLTAKTEDLESRSRSQNLRILGIPENSEGPRITDFMTDFFAGTLGMNVKDGPELLDRAHRLASRPVSGPNAPPRPMIVRVHHFRVKQHILQLAREKGPLSFRGHPVHIFPDFTTEVASRRASFNNVKQKLRAANIRYGLLFPARLRVTFNGGRYSFTTPEDAEKFYVGTIAPALQAGEALGTNENEG